MMKNNLSLLILSSFLTILACTTSCSNKVEKKGEEQLTVVSESDNNEPYDSVQNSVTGNVTMKQIASFPSTVILTGLNDHRLVSVYKSRVKPNSNEISRTFSYSSDNEYSEDQSSEHFMPGIDILFGYNLLNIAHYDIKLEKSSYLFNHPVLIKTLYYPSLIQDSIDNLPINRDFYLISVYDEDTNKDTLINKYDLRRFYCFNASATEKAQLIPADYSAIRSQYDSKNDIMYVFAKHDENKNGTQDNTEPIHVFWFSLKAPAKAKLLY
jgi:hypothetical protein